MKAAFLHGILLKLVSLFPYRAKSWFYGHPRLASLARKFLNFGLSSSEKISVVNLNSDLMRGYKMGIDLQKEKPYWLGTYEPGVVQIFSDIVKNGMIVYDVGGHIGYLSLLFSKLCGKAGRVFSFEPDPENYQRLVKNMELNKIKNVVAVKVAISDKKELALFEAGEHDSMKHLLGQKKGNEKNVIKVQAETLDEFAFLGKNPLPQIIKIDVEGAESKVIRGAEHIIKEMSPTIICEVHNYEAAQEIFKILSPKYAFFDIRNNLAKIDDFSGYNGICNVLLKPSVGI